LPLTDGMKITRSLVVVFLCLVVSAHAADELIALKSARMFDGQIERSRAERVVVVEGGKIVDVEAICQSLALHT
jgi:hypothetical protein